MRIIYIIQNSNITEIKISYHESETLKFLLMNIVRSETRLPSKYCLSLLVQFTKQ